MEYSPQQSRKVVRNCPNYQDALVSLEQLLNDPRRELEDSIKFQVLDHEGNVRHYAHFDHWNLLSGENLGFREIEWQFGHCKLIHFSVFSEAIVFLVATVCRGIYHAFWLACYLFVLSMSIGLPLLVLMLAWSWVVQLIHG